MHVHTVYLGWGWGGRGRDSSKLKHRGQYRAASTLGFLVAVVVAESRPVCSHWVPILQSCLGGLPGASELLSEGSLAFHAQAESEGQWSGDGVVCRIMCGQEVTRKKRLGWDALEYPIQSDRYCSFLLLTWGGPERKETSPLFLTPTEGL